MKLEHYSIILAIIPFVVIIVFGFIFDCFSPRTHLYKIVSSISEKDLKKWMRKAGFEKTSEFLFQIFRVVASITIAFLLAFVLFADNIKMFISVLIIGSLVIYKLIYYYLILISKQRVNKLNQLIPYMMKTIIYLCHIYPLNNALLVAVDYVPQEFQNDMIKLVRDIDEQGNSDQPFKNFINAYDGELKNLDMYFSMLYRMGTNTKLNDANLLNSLNKMIDEDVDRVRTEKNITINKRVSTIGNIPLALLTIMCVYLMVLMTEMI